jgi:4-amino-4-deoxy-L-arabinose transferase-like glycosyltransferase
LEKGNCKRDKVKKNRKFFASSLLLILASIFMRSFFLHPTFSDESFYFNVAKNLAEGKVLYKDFFFAHPPLQVYLLALLFKIFGASFLIAKTLPLMTSSICVLMLYFIMKKLGDEKAGFIACIFFILMPAFLAFSVIENGVWEAMFFLLLSVYFIFEGKLFLSSLSFLFSFLFRYFSILYFPFLLMLAYLRKQRILKLLGYSIIFLSLFLLFLILIFGNEYISQTISYHFLKAGISEPFSSQYWRFGYFTFFLSLISVLVTYTEKKKILFLFSSIPLIVDSSLLIFLKVTFYHYFLLSLPFCVLAAAKIWKDTSNKPIKFTIPIIIIVSIFSNFATLDFYLNPLHAKKFHQIAEFVERFADENETIFGEPIATNYASFITGRKISGNYLDSYLSHLKFEGEEKIMKKLSTEKPKVFIEMKFGKDYYFLSNANFKNFLKGYKIEKSIEGIPTYLLMKNLI